MLWGTKMIKYLDSSHGSLAELYLTDELTGSQCPILKKQRLLEPPDSDLCVFTLFFCSSCVLNYVSSQGVWPGMAAAATFDPISVKTCSVKIQFLILTMGGAPFLMCQVMTSLEELWVVLLVRVTSKICPEEIPCSTEITAQSYVMTVVMSHCESGVIGT